MENKCKVCGKHICTTEDMVSRTESTSDQNIVIDNEDD